MNNKYNLDEVFNRKNDKSRKWDYSFVKQRFGDVPQDFIAMWIADMDFRTPDEIRRDFYKIIDQGTFGYTYTYQEFYDAVIDWQERRHKNKVSQEWITLSYGTVSTIHYLIQAFCQPDDFIIMNTPVYDPFYLAAERNHVNVICNDLLVVDNRYEIDWDTLEKEIIDKRPRLYLFCSPHNPSGRIWSKVEIEKVASICQKHHVILVVDEVHSEHILYGDYYSSLKLGEEYRDNLILLTSPNKGFNLGGLKTSYSIIPNKGLRMIFRKRLEKNSITSPNLFGIAGTISAYNNGEEWLEKVVEYLRENYEYVLNFINLYIPEWKVMKMESSYLVWIEISGSKITATELVKELACKTGVVVEDGTHYVSNGQNYIRINLGMPKKLIEDAMNRIYIYIKNRGEK